MVHRDMTKPSNLRERFAQNLRRIRRERGLTQDVMAKLADVDRTYVSSLENCGNSASLDMIAKLATVLGVDPIAMLERRPSHPKK
jgi:transcriptional regulator with XRE-family HTH domain